MNKMWKYYWKYIRRERCTELEIILHNTDMILKGNFIERQESRRKTADHSLQKKFENFIDNLVFPPMIFLISKGRIRNQEART